jgi:hypothetical protein
MTMTIAEGAGIGMPVGYVNSAYDRGAPDLWSIQASVISFIVIKDKHP